MPEQIVRLVRRSAGHGCVEDGNDVVGGDVGDGPAPPAGNKFLLKVALSFNALALLRLIQVGPDDSEADIFLAHHPERVCSASLLLDALAVLIFTRVDALSEQFEPVAGLGASLFERERSILSERAAGRILAAGETRDENERQA